jgi:ankyrin repeat protein
MGYARFQKDYTGDSPLSLTINAKCISAVETLLKGNYQALFALNTLGMSHLYPQNFLKEARIDDAQLHDIIVECLMQHKVLLPVIFSYHDLPSQPWFDRTKFAQKLFLAGFQDIDAYNPTGETSLMVACLSGNLRMASFLLQHGADPFKCHEHVGLRAGHLRVLGGEFIRINKRR